MKNEYEIRGDVTVIFVKRRNGDVYEFLVDTEDLPAVMSFSNSYKIAECAGKLYVKGYRKIGVNQYEHPYLHRLLTRAPPKRVVDHINGVTLDNRRSNLRVVSQSENLQNRKGAMTNSASGVRGVFRRNDCDRWEAQVVVNRKKYRSLHLTLEEAIEAVKEMRRRYLPYSEDAKEALAC